MARFSGPASQSVRRKGYSFEAIRTSYYFGKVRDLVQPTLSSVIGMGFMIYFVKDVAFLCIFRSACDFFFFVRMKWGSACLFLGFFRESVLSFCAFAYISYEKKIMKYILDRLLFFVNYCCCLFHVRIFIKSSTEL